MKTTRKCLACKAYFLADYQNGQRQGYRPQDSCQRARLRQEQRLRRAAAKLLQPLRQALDGSRRLQTASQEHEAFLASQSPVIIGLISTLTDSLSREDLEKTVWRLWQRGQSVLGYQDATALKKRSKAKGKAESAQ